ncbi:MAG: DinB family protein [Acidobacteria bacterium]|nr:DinB family protein [Acidobacteriota bacterium]
MSEIDRIQDQLKRAFDGEAWHGPSVMEVLDGVTAEQAASKPVSRAHSIWEIVLHLQTWEAIACKRIHSEAVEATPDIDWPPVKEITKPAWAAAIHALRAGHHGLRVGVAKLDDSDLIRTAPGTGYSLYFLLHGVIQHDLYHAGQMALIKRALA